jgi:hypothetical protein
MAPCAGDSKPPTLMARSRSPPEEWVPVGADNPVQAVQQDFRWRDTDDEDGAWRSPSSTLPSFVSSSCSVSHAVRNGTWPSRSSCSATRSRYCAARSSALLCAQRTEHCSLG